MRVLSEADVERLLPTPLEAVHLAREALTAISDGVAEVPPKPTVHLGDGAFANAMPAALPRRNLLGCKWISIVPANAERGLATASGLVVVNDGTTGLPRCVMPAGALTALRTAAVSGACVAGLAPGASVVAILGAGVQARSHLRVLAALGHRRVVVWARRRAALDELAAWGAVSAPEVEVVPAASREDAVRGADVVVTALGMGAPGLELAPAWVGGDALLLPLDYATCVGPGLAAQSLLAADHPGQFEAMRREGKLGDYPGTEVATGTLLAQPRRGGRIVCQNLGNGLSDLVVADVVARRAEEQGAGTVVDHAT